MRIEETLLGRLRPVIKADGTLLVHHFLGKCCAMESWKPFHLYENNYSLKACLSWFATYWTRIGENTTPWSCALHGYPEKRLNVHFHLTANKLDCSWGRFQQQEKPLNLVVFYGDGEAFLDDIWPHRRYLRNQQTAQAPSLRQHARDFWTLLQWSKLLSLVYSSCQFKLPAVHYSCRLTVFAVSWSWSCEVRFAG